MFDRPMPRSYCSYCKCHVEPNTHWFWMEDTRYKAGGKWRCKVAKRDSGARYRAKISKDQIRYQEHLLYQREYAHRYPNRAKVKAYQHSDRRHCNLSIDIKNALDIMSKPCFYCGVDPSNGLDRKDNKLGHEIKNVVPCCEKCNYLLSDIPWEAKCIMSPSLIEIRKQKLLDSWQIPTKRSQSNV